MDPVHAAGAIMRAFCERTGVIGEAPARRYLWTDAFAVCNCLALNRHGAPGGWLALAERLIDQVHRVLGRHRPDDLRNGWLSGLPDEQASRHPTAGGLRIGKPLPERAPGEPEDDATDWDRDGQYHHYLTRWMHALGRTAAVTGSADRLRHAVELARVTHAAFAHDSPHGRQLYWKMSVDLSHPAVAAPGQHDALDGLVETAWLHALAAERRLEPALAAELNDLLEMCAGRSWATRDALGIGTLLIDALFLARLHGTVGTIPQEILARVLYDAARSLRLASIGRYMEGPAEGRVAFRELGLALGLAAVDRLEQMRAHGLLVHGDIVNRSLDELLEHLHLRTRVENFWLDPDHQHAATWTRHEDINAVMLVTALLPDGYLD
jgi:hypothetical protein